jgi:hypothetical protein
MMDAFPFLARDLDGSLAHRDTFLPGRVVDRELKSTAILRGGISSQQAETFNRKIVTAVGRRILDED